MAYLILPSRLRRRAGGLVGVNRNVSLTDGLVRLWDFSQPLQQAQVSGLGMGGLTAIGTPTRVTTPWGVAAQFPDSSSHGAYTTDDAYRTRLGSGFTVFIDTQQFGYWAEGSTIYIGNADTGPYAYNKNWILSHHDWQSGKQRFVVQNTSDTAFSAVHHVASGGYDRMLIVGVLRGTTVEIWKNGVKGTTTGTLTGTLKSTAFQTRFNTAFGATSGYSRTRSAGIVARAWSEDEIVAWCRNPNQVFASRSPTLYFFATAGGGPTTGTLSATEGADTASAAGNRKFAGTLAATEGSDTASLAGSVSVPANVGTLTATEAADTFAAAGSRVERGTLAATEGTDTAALAGGVAHTGTIAATEGSDTASLAGDVAHTGTLAATEGSDTFAAAGWAGVVVDVYGTLAATEGPDTASLAGSKVPRGTLAATEASDTVAIAGNRKYAGTLAATEGADTTALAGTVSVPGVDVTGSLAATEGPDTASLAGTKLHRGTFAATESSDTAAIVGAKLHRGTLAATEAQDTASLAGTSTSPALITGTLAATEAPDTVLLSSGSILPPAGMPGAGSEVDWSNLRLDVTIPRIIADIDFAPTGFSELDLGTFPLWPVLKETVILSEVFSLNLSFRAPGEEVYAEDRVTGLHRGRSAAEILPTADNLTRVVTFRKTLADEVTVPDDFASAERFNLTFTLDTAEARDALQRATTWRGAEQVTTVDGVLAARNSAASDSSGATDQLSTVTSFRREFGDSLSQPDAAKVSLTKRATDAASVADLAARAFAKPRTDGAAATDASVRRSVKALSEPQIALDSIATTMLFRRSLADSATVADGVVTQFPNEVEKLEVAVVSEAIAKMMTRAYADSRTVVESVSLTPRKGHTEPSVGATDSGTIVFEGGYADDYFAADYTELTLINF